MSRSSKKKPFIAPELLKRIEAMNAEGKKEVLKTWSRASTIYPQMVGHTIAVHDGRKHVPVYISEEMNNTLRALPLSRDPSATLGMTRVGG